MEHGYLVNLMLFVIAAYGITCTRSELFTAIVDLNKILYAENSLATDLKQYIALEEERILKLKALAADYESHSAEALANPEKHFANPVNAFLLVKRFTTDWEYVLETLVRGNSSTEFLERLDTHTEFFPTDQDLEGAASALMRLQDTYALPTEKIAKGDLYGIDTSPELSAHDCFELGRLAYNQGDWYHAVKWMGQALAILDEEVYPSIDEAITLDYYSYATYMQGNLQHAKNLTIQWLQLEPDHERAQNNLRYYNEMLEKAAQGKGDEGQQPEEFQNKRIMDEYRQSEEFAHYEALCRGEDIMPLYNEHKLTCQYKRHHPLFFIDPLKEETISFKPWLALYHDVITEKEMALVKEMAVPKLARATARNAATGRYEAADYRISKRYASRVSQYIVRGLDPGVLLHRSGVFTRNEGDSSLTSNRVSKSAWIYDEENFAIERISRRCAAMTNLTLESVEALQVVNYGIGGHYEPHFDFARENELSAFEEWRGNRILTVIFYPEEKNTFEEWRGNRILTVIFYISEVLSGGRTVFPQVGIKVSPVKGAAAVWYNLLANGDGDYSTRHAGCPVLTGQKWVCNKWFHERGQEFRRPCDVDPSL